MPPALILGALAAPCRTSDPLLELGVLGFGLFLDGEIGVGVFPHGEKILIGSSRLGFVAGQGVGAALA